MRLGLGQRQARRNERGAYKCFHQREEECVFSREPFSIIFRARIALPSRNELLLILFMLLDLIFLKIILIQPNGA